MKRALIAVSVCLLAGCGRSGTTKFMVAFSQAKGYAPKHPAVLAANPKAAYRLPASRNP